MDPTQMLSRSEEAEQFLKQLSHKTRLMVLCSLLEGERSVTEFVATRRSGQTIYYRLADNRIIQIMNLLYGFFCADD